MTPSAAIVGVMNLTLFGPRRELYARPADVFNRRPDFYININGAADSGPPPAHTLGVARLIGGPHLGYEARASP